MPEQNDNIVLAFLKCEVLLPRDRQRLRDLVAMNGITDDEQQELYNLVLNPWCDVDALRQKCESYVERGAAYVYPNRAGKH